MRLLPVGLPRKPPRVDHAPPADDFRAAAEALEIAELAALTLDDWQQYALARSMGMVDGRWAAFECGLVVPRQNGKTEALVARICAALFTELDDPRLTIFTAHEYKTAREVFMRLANLLDPPRDADPLLVADPFFQSQVRSIRRANGEESIELQNGRRARFLARTSGSGRGFTGDLMILDEAYKLAGEQMAALLPTLGARPNPQVYYASMGPFEDSEQQLSIRDRGINGDPTLCYLEWSAPDEAALDDPDVWAAANPAHPHRKSDGQLRRERAALADEEFAREILAMRVSSVSAVITLSAWLNVQSQDAAPDGEFVLAVDMGPDRHSVAVAAADKAGNVELVDHRPAVGAKEWLVDLAVKHGRPVAVDSASQAATFRPDLEAADVEVVEYASPDMAAACGRFYDMVNGGLVKIRTHPSLDSARSGATQRPLGDGMWAWSRRKSTVDISPLVAATLAVDAAANHQGSWEPVTAWA